MSAEETIDPVVSRIHSLEEQIQVQEYQIAILESRLARSGRSRFQIPSRVGVILFLGFAIWRSLSRDDGLRLSALEEEHRLFMANLPPDFAIASLLSKCDTACSRIPVLEMEIAALRKQLDSGTPLPSDARIPEPPNESGSIEFPLPARGSRFNGIIRYLADSGNAHEGGKVRITYLNESSVPQLGDVDSPDIWRCKMGKSSRLTFRFLNGRVWPAGYGLKTPAVFSGFWARAWYKFFRIRGPSSWSFEGSDDGVTWTTLDSRETKELSGHGRSALFPVQAQRSFAILRFDFHHPELPRMIALSAVEFFGEFREVPQRESD
jgi:hypothetical protein